MIKTYILTLQIDAESQAFFDEQRQLHFPKSINYLKAHLTLFHKLPVEKYVTEALEDFTKTCFEMDVTKPINIGNGVAYALGGKEISHIHQHFSRKFNADLIPQDKQGFRPHITIQNKVEPAKASALLSTIQQDFIPFKVIAKGLDLWYYLGGPWEHVTNYPFTDAYTIKNQQLTAVN